jgi:hypothetical protein
LLIGVWVAVAGCGTQTVTVTAPVKAPPPSAQTSLRASQTAGEEGIRHDMHPSAGFRARQVPHFTPATGCGVERWAVKTLTDPGASRINLTAQDSTVLKLGGIAPPRDPTDRLAPTETTVFRLTDVQMTAFKQEADSDIHVAIKDTAGQTMIAELPSASCDSTAQPTLRSEMTTARNAFVAACGQPTGSYHTITGKATITGVGFFDRIHGQRGVAPNGIELHPVLTFKAQTCSR